MNAPTQPYVSKEVIKKECEHHASCMKTIQSILDGEATESEKEHFRQNMDKCLPCIETYRYEKCVKDSLQNKVEKVPCPKNIIATILSKLNIMA
jgi:anti-sigma factor (TIGR02949 family)